MQGHTTLEGVLRRDRAVVLGGLMAIAVLAWAYMVYLAWEMGRMAMTMGMAMPRMQDLGLPGPGCAVCHVGSDDDSHDGANGGADDPDVCHAQPQTSGAARAVCAYGGFSERVREVD